VMLRAVTLTLALLPAVVSCDSDAGSPASAPRPVANKTVSPTPPAGWSRFYEYGFAMWIPPDYTYQAIQGEDSFIGAFNGEQVYVEFDFGWYSDLTKTHRGKPGIEETPITLDGQAGFIWRVTDDGQDTSGSEKRPQEPLPRVIILNVPKINGSDDGLWVRVRYKDPVKEPEILRMLRTITFPEFRAG
jgi:hypothetical protein